MKNIYISSASYNDIDFAVNEEVIYYSDRFIKKATISALTYAEGNKIVANLKVSGNSEEDTVFLNKIHKDVDLIKFNIYQYDSLTLGMVPSFKDGFAGDTSYSYTISGFMSIINNGSVELEATSSDGTKYLAYVPYDMIDIDTTLANNNAAKDTRSGIIKVIEIGKDTKYELGEHVKFIDGNGNIVSGDIKGFDVSKGSVVAYVKTTTADKKLDLTTITPYPDGKEFKITGVNGITVGTTANYTGIDGDINSVEISAYEWHSYHIFAIGNATISNKQVGKVYVPCEVIS